MEKCFLCLHSVYTKAWVPKDQVWDECVNGCVSIFSLEEYLLVGSWKPTIYTQQCQSTDHIPVFESDQMGFGCNGVGSCPFQHSLLQDWGCLCGSGDGLCRAGESKARTLEVSEFQNLCTPTPDTVKVCTVSFQIYCAVVREELSYAVTTLFSRQLTVPGGLTVDHILASERLWLWTGWDSRNCSGTSSFSCCLSGGWILYSICCLSTWVGITLTLWSVWTKANLELLRRRWSDEVIVWSALLQIREWWEPMIWRVWKR